MGACVICPVDGGLSACAPQSPSAAATGARNQVVLVIDRATRSRVLAMEGPPKQKKIADRINEELRDLRIVSIKRLGLVEWPEQCLVNSTETLKTLRITSNLIRDLPPFLGEFKILQTLDLSSNEISVVDLDFSLFPASLQSLSLRHNQLKGQITGLEHLVSLVELDISENKDINRIDHVDWTRLISLEELNMDNLSLTSLPSNLGSLPRLQVLSAKSNALKPTDASIPQILLQNARSLHTLYLDGNDGITEAVFMKLPGAESYMRRRKARLDKQIAGGTYSPDLAVI